MIILADVVWPSLFLAGRLFAWWIVGVGLLIEFLFVLRLAQVAPGRAAMMTAVMNAISAGVGIVGIPLSGILWEFVASVTIMPLFNLGTFNPITWTVSCLLAALLNTLVEVGALRLIFGVAWTKRLFCGLMLANSITVGMALASIMLSPPTT